MIPYIQTDQLGDNCAHTKQTDILEGSYAHTRQLVCVAQKQICPS